MIKIHTGLSIAWGVSRLVLPPVLLLAAFVGVLGHHTPAVWHWLGLGRMARAADSHQLGFRVIGLTVVAFLMTVAAPAGFWLLGAYLVGGSVGLAYAFLYPMIVYGQPPSVGLIALSCLAGFSVAGLAGSAKVLVEWWRSHALERHGRVGK